MVCALFDLKDELAGNSTAHIWLLQTNRHILWVNVCAKVRDGEVRPAEYVYKRQLACAALTMFFQLSNWVKAPFCQESEHSLECDNPSCIQNIVPYKRNAVVAREE